MAFRETHLGLSICIGTLSATTKKQSDEEAKSLPEAPAPLPDSHGVAFTNEELDALTDCDEASVL